MRLEYEITGDMSQLKRVLRGAEQEIVASGRRMDTAVRRRGGAATPAAATRASNETKRAAASAARDIERQRKEDIRIRNLINNLEVKDWQKKEAEKTRVARQEAAKRRRDDEREIRRKRHLANQEVRTVRRSRESTGRGALRSAGGTARNVLGMGGTVLGVAGGIGAAMALDKTLSNEDTAIDIVNASSVNTKGRNAAGVQEEAGKLALSKRVMSEDVLGAIQKFQAPTGNLDQAMQAMPQLIDLARGTGTALSDMAEAAGRVIAADENMSLDNLMTTMRTIAGQGKRGAVEIRELASAMAKLTGAAGLIGGDKGKAIAELGAISQMAVKAGGAQGGEEAGTAVSRFVNQASEKAGNFPGVSIKDASGMVESPRKIIEELIDKSQGGRKFDITDFGIEGNKAVLGFLSTYNSAMGDHAEKMKAVRTEFDKFLGPGAVMSKTEVDTAAQKRMASGSSQLAEATEKFHQAVGRELLPAVTDLVPQFVKLLPSVVDVTKALVRFLKFFAENPVTTIGLLVGGAIVKDIIAAKVGERVAAALSTVVGGKGAPTGGVPTSGTPLGTKLTAGLAAGAAGFALGTGIAEGVVDPLLTGSGSGERSGVLMASNLDSATKALRSGKMSKEQASKFLEDAKRTKSNAELNSTASALADATFGGGSLKKFSENRSIANSEEFAKSIATLQQALDSMNTNNADSLSKLSIAADKAATALTLAAAAARGGSPTDPNRGGAPILKRP